MFRPIAAFILLATAATGPARAADLELQAGAHYVQAVVNGHAVRLRVDPEAPGYILLNPGAIQRVGLRPSMTRARTFVGPVRLTGRTKSTTVTIGNRTDERRIIWMDRDAVTDADGLIGPADLPYDRVTFHLRAAGPGEQLLTLPLAFDRSTGLSHRQRVGDQEVGFKLATGTPQTLATAAAGALLAARHGGTWAGEAREHPVRFGVMRPARPLTLGTALPIAGLPLARMLVRTRDDRGNAVLPAENDADPDEMVVTAGSERQRARYTVILGADWLAGCSSLVWDNGTRVMTVSCRAS